MPKYKTKNLDDEHVYDSEYESDGETVYTHEQNLGSGDYANARLFSSKTDEKKTVVVLNPVKFPADFKEAQIKARFFQTIYPDFSTSLFDSKSLKIEDSKDSEYRLVLPHLNAVSYKNLLTNKLISDFNLQWKIFNSAIEALQDCHSKGLILIDLNLDNVLFDFKTNKTYFIDGGLSVPIGQPLDAEVFIKKDFLSIEIAKKEYQNIAPECWMLPSEKILASTSMDIYSLGVLMLDLFEFPAYKIEYLIKSCFKKEPKKRPLLGDLKRALMEMPHLSYNPLSYHKSHWAMRFPVYSDENFIAILELDGIKITVILNDTDSRGYRMIVKLFDDEISSTLNRMYTDEEYTALSTVLALLASVYREFGMTVNTEIAGNNSQSLVDTKCIQLGNELEPSILHGHVIGRGDPQICYIADVPLRGPMVGQLFNLRGESSSQEGNQTKEKWQPGEMERVASIFVKELIRKIESSKHYNSLINIVSLKPTEGVEIRDETIYKF